MKWVKVNDYAIKSGPYQICKVYLDGTTLYVLWNGDERVKHFEDPDEAREMANQLAKEKP